MITGVLALYTFSRCKLVAVYKAGGQFRAGKNIINACGRVGGGIGKTELVGMEMSKAINVSRLQEQVNTSFGIAIAHFIQQQCARREMQKSFGNRYCNPFAQWSWRQLFIFIDP